MICTLLQDAFGSNLNAHFENLNYVFHFQILMILRKSKQRKVISAQLIHTVQ